MVQKQWWRTGLWAPFRQWLYVTSFPVVLSQKTTPRCYLRICLLKELIFFPLFLFYVDSCFPCMHVCTRCVYSACGNQKGVLDPQTRVTATCEQPLLITAEQSLQLRGLASLSPFLPLPSLLHPIKALCHRLWLSKGKCFLASSDSLTIFLSGGKVFEFEHELWPVPPRLRCLVGTLSTMNKTTL